MVQDRRLLWVISYHHACNDGTLMALVAVLPILIREMDLSYSDVGILGFGLLITVVVQFFVGKASDRRFSRYMLEVGAGLMALSFVLIPLVSDFTGLFIVVIAMRVGASFYHPIGVSWITRQYQGPYMDTALGIQSGVGNLGVILALGSSGFLGELFGWKVPCITWAFLNILAVILGLSFTKGHEPASYTTNHCRKRDDTRDIQEDRTNRLPDSCGWGILPSHDLLRPHQPDADAWMEHRRCGPHVCRMDWDWHPDIILLRKSERAVRTHSRAEVWICDWMRRSLPARIHVRMVLDSAHTRSLWSSVLPDVPCPIRSGIKRH